jgi:hypothetical protein
MLGIRRPETCGDDLRRWNLPVMEFESTVAALIVIYRNRIKNFSRLIFLQAHPLASAMIQSSALSAISLSLFFSFFIAAILYAEAATEEENEGRKSGRRLLGWFLLVAVGVT